MAQPGERFNFDFAMGILQLAQQRKIKQAELEEMRNERASRNFLEKERLSVARQGQFLQSIQEGNQLAFQEKQAEAQAEIQKTAQLARIQLETKKIEQEREASVTRALDDFGRTGTAFVPTFALDRLKSITSSNTSEVGIATVDVPGAGVIIQRISNPEARSKLDKTLAEIDKIKQDSAVAHQRQLLLEAQTEKESQRAQSLVGKIGGPAVVATINNQWGDLIKQAQDKSRTLLLLGKTPEDHARAQRIELDPREAFKDQPEQLKLFDSTRAVINALTISLQQGIDLARTPTDLQALDAADVTHVLTASTTNERIVGKVAGPPTRVQSGRERASGPTTYQLLTSTGRRLEVDAATYASTQVGTSLGAGATPATTAGPVPPSSPDRRAALTSEADQLIPIFQREPRGSPVSERARLRLLEIQTELSK